MKLPYQEGTWFAVPLLKGGYGIGLIARSTTIGKVLLGYFFGPRRESVPPVSDLICLRPTDAILVIRFGDLALYRKEWPIIGYSSKWERGDWVMPQFIRNELLAKRVWKVYRSDTDPSIVDKEELVTNNNISLERDSLWGSGAVEKGLTNILDP
jgi:hypothetical protein